MTANKAVRVYQERIRRGSKEADAPTTVVYACLPGSRRIKLGTKSRFLNAGTNTYEFRVAGTWVAFGRTRCSRFSCDGALVRVNTRTRKRHVTPVTTPNHAYVSDLELMSNGSVAWINGSLPTESGNASEVRKLDSTGEQVLDPSSDQIDPRSLALSGSTLYWTKSGVPYTATLS